jgi:hypothetical protein
MRSEWEERPFSKEIWGAPSFHGDTAEAGGKNFAAPGADLSLFCMPGEWKERRRRTLVKNFTKRSCVGFGQPL